MTKAVSKVRLFALQGIRFCLSAFFLQLDKWGVEDMKPVIDYCGKKMFVDGVKMVTVPDSEALLRWSTWKRPIVRAF